MMNQPEASGKEKQN